MYEYKTLYQSVNDFPERLSADQALNTADAEGWEPVNISVVSDTSTKLYRIVTLRRAFDRGDQTMASSTS